MPIKFAKQTAFVHKDREVQYEFERLKQNVSAIDRQGIANINQYGPGNQTGIQVPKEAVEQKTLSVLHNDRTVINEITEYLNFIDTQIGFPEASLNAKIKFLIREIQKDINSSQANIQANAYISGLELLQFLQGFNIIAPIYYDLTIQDNTHVYPITDTTIQELLRSGGRVWAILINGITYRGGTYFSDKPIRYNYNTQEIEWFFTKANGGFNLRSTDKAYLKVL